MPESWNTETRPGKSVHVGGDLPKPSLAHPESPKGSSSDPAAMEEASAKTTLYSFKT
jgi:hypothetical protein